MKKLILALGAVATACSLQAASFTWDFFNTDTVDKNGALFDGVNTDASAFLYLGTVSLSGGAFNFGTATLLASVQGVDTSSWNWGDFTAPGSNANDLVVAAGGQAYTLILVDKGGVSDLTSFEGNAIVAFNEEGSVPMSTPTGGTTVYYAAFTNDMAYGASDWKTVSASVPEPTSGLLLLIGMAGLALKRKRA